MRLPIRVLEPVAECGPSLILEGADEADPRRRLSRPDELEHHPGATGKVDCSTGLERRFGDDHTFAVRVPEDDFIHHAAVRFVAGATPPTLFLPALSDS
jgi:hypothetical protein